MPANLTARPSLSLIRRCAWTVAAEYWGEAPYPTGTTVGLTWLSEFQFEIKAIAKLSEGMQPWMW